MALLSRTEFRTQVLNLLRRNCAVPDCDEPAVDAHHILERALWVDGGYYLDNGAPVCPGHHVAAERTTLRADQLRTWCGHTTVHLPEHLDPSLSYDKWGNVVHCDGTRSPGEIFFAEQTQAALRAGGVLDLFDRRVRYPRTFHLPDSPGRSNDDKVLSSLAGLTGIDVVVTEKMDGGNVTWMRTATYARSVDSATHPSRHYVKALWAARSHDIPTGWRISGEDLYARRSVAYDNLPAYFVIFGIWDDTNTLLSWDDTVTWACLLDLPTAPVLYRGTDLTAARAAWAKQRNDEVSEGFVVRDAGPIAASEFGSRVGKWVRAAHVRTRDDFRSRDDFTVNGLAQPATVRERPPPDAPGGGRSACRDQRLMIVSAVAATFGPAHLEGERTCQARAGTVSSDATRTRTRPRRLRSRPATCRRATRSGPCSTSTPPTGSTRSV